MDSDYMVHLEDLTMKELEELMNDEDRINQFVMDDDRLKKLKLDREMTLAENRSIADNNLGKEPQLQYLKSNIEKKYAEVKQLHDAYQVNRAKIASLGKEDNLDTMLAVLQTKSAECDENTEQLAERFYNKEIDINDFISQFREQRRLSHLRQVKADKMKALVLEVQRNHVSNPTPYNPPPQPMARNRGHSYHGNPQPTQPPYPPYPGFGSSHNSSPSFQQTPQSYPEYSW